MAESRSHILTNIPLTPAKSLHSNISTSLLSPTSQTSRTHTTIHHAYREARTSHDPTHISQHNPALHKGEYHSGHVGGYHIGADMKLDPVLTDSQEEERRHRHHHAHGHHPPHHEHSHHSGHPSHHSEHASHASHHSHLLGEGLSHHSHLDHTGSHHSLHPVEGQSHHSHHDPSVSHHSLHPGEAASHHSHLEAHPSHHTLHLPEALSHHSHHSLHPGEGQSPPSHHEPSLSHHSIHPAGGASLHSHHEPSMSQQAAHALDGASHHSHLSHQSALSHHSRPPSFSPFGHRSHHSSSVAEAAHHPMMFDPDGSRHSKMGSHRSHRASQFGDLNATSHHSQHPSRGQVAVVNDPFLCVGSHHSGKLGEHEQRPGGGSTHLHREKSAISTPQPDIGSTDPKTKSPAGQSPSVDDLAISSFLHPADHHLTPEDMKHLSDVHTHLPIAGRLLPPPHETGHSTHHSKKHHRKDIPRETKSTQTYRDLQDTDDDMIKPGDSKTGPVIKPSKMDRKSRIDLDRKIQASLNPLSHLRSGSHHSNISKGKEKRGGDTGGTRSSRDGRHGDDRSRHVRGSSSGSSKGSSGSDSSSKKKREMRHKYTIVSGTNIDKDDYEPTPSLAALRRQAESSRKRRSTVRDGRKESYSRRRSSSRRDSRARRNTEDILRDLKLEQDPCKRFYAKPTDRNRKQTVEQRRRSSQERRRSSSRPAGTLCLTDSERRRRRCERFSLKSAESMASSEEDVSDETSRERRLSQRKGSSRRSSADSRRGSAGERRGSSRRSTSVRSAKQEEDDDNELPVPGIRKSLLEKSSEETKEQKRKSSTKESSQNKEVSDSGKRRSTAAGPAGKREENKKRSTIAKPDAVDEPEKRDDRRRSTVKKTDQKDDKEKNESHRRSMGKGSDSAGDKGEDKTRRRSTVKKSDSPSEKEKDKQRKQSLEKETDDQEEKEPVSKKRRSSAKRESLREENVYSKRHPKTDRQSYVGYEDRNSISGFRRRSTPRESTSNRDSRWGVSQDETNRPSLSDRCGASARDSLAHYESHSMDDRRRQSSSRRSTLNREWLSIDSEGTDSEQVSESFIDPVTRLRNALYDDGTTIRPEDICGTVIPPRFYLAPPVNPMQFLKFAPEPPDSEFRKAARQLLNQSGPPGLQPDVCGNAIKLPQPRVNFPPDCSIQKRTGDSRRESCSATRKSINVNGCSSNLPSVEDNIEFQRRDEKERRRRSSVRSYLDDLEAVRSDGRRRSSRRSSAGQRRPSGVSSAASSEGSIRIRLSEYDQTASRRRKSSSRKKSESSELVSRCRNGLGKGRKSSAALELTHASDRRRRSSVRKRDGRESGRRRSERSPSVSESRKKTKNKRSSAIKFEEPCEPERPSPDQPRNTTTSATPHHHPLTAPFYQGANDDPHVEHSGNHLELPVRRAPHATHDPSNDSKAPPSLPVPDIHLPSAAAESVQAKASSLEGSNLSTLPAQIQPSVTPSAAKSATSRQKLKHVVRHIHRPKNVKNAPKATQTSAHKLGYTSEHDMVKHDGNHRKLSLLPRAPKTTPESRKKSLPPKPKPRTETPHSKKEKRSRSARPASSSDSDSSSKNSSKSSEDKSRRADSRKGHKSVDSFEEPRRQSRRRSSQNRPFGPCPPLPRGLAAGIPRESLRPRQNSFPFEEAGVRASFSPVENFSDLPSSVLSDASVLHPVPLHLQTYQRDYCYDASQLRYLIVNILKRLEKRHIKKMKLVCDLTWAREEEKLQRKLTDELEQSYKENLIIFEKMLRKKESVQAFTSDRRMDEFNRRIRNIQTRLAQIIDKKQRLMCDARQTADQTLSLFAKTMENVNDQWMQELTYLRGENAVLDAEYYRTQAAIRQTGTELAQSADKTRSATPRSDDFEGVASQDDNLSQTASVLREARRDRALYYDQVLAMRGQCNKALETRNRRVQQHFQQFSQQMSGISRGLQQVVKNLNQLCDTTQSVLAHPIVHCFVLACGPMHMDIVNETLRQAQEEYRKLVESLKRCRTTNAEQNDRALAKADDYDVEESLLPRFRRHVGEDVRDTGWCSFAT